MQFTVVGLAKLFSEAAEKMCAPVGNWDTHLHHGLNWPGKQKWEIVHEPSVQTFLEYHYETLAHFAVLQSLFLSV